MALPRADYEAGNNLWLEMLSSKSRAAVLEHATLTTLPVRHEVHRAGTVARHIYFPTTAVFSMVVELEGGKPVEGIMVGREGYAPALSTLSPISHTAVTIVQVGGDALAVETPSFMRLINEYEEIALLRERYIAALMDGLMLCCACNAVHTVRQRCARWLLALSDRTQSSDVRVIHLILAETLGASRPRVTEILASLQREGLLELQRATLRIVDKAGLEAASCECYARIKAELARVGNPT